MPKTLRLTIENHDALTGVWVPESDYDRLEEQLAELQEQIADLQEDLRESHERRQELECELSELTPCPRPESE